MPRLFAGNRDISFLRSSTGVQSVTTAGRFDASYVAQGVLVSGNETAETPPWYGGVASVTAFSVRMDAYCTLTGTNSIFELLNTSGVIVLQVRASATDLTIWGWNGTALVQIGATAAVGINTVLRKLVLNGTCGAGGTISLYVGDVLVTSGTGFASIDNIARLRLRGGGSVSSPSVIFSQVMVADFDLRDANMFSQLASANGANTGGTGAASDVSESPRNDTTRILMATTGLKRTFTKAAVTVPAGKVIRALGANMIARQQGGVVTNAYGIRRFSAVDNRSALLGIQTAYETRGFVHEPGGVITQADYNATELGFESA